MRREMQVRFDALCGNAEIAAIDIVNAYGEDQQRERYPMQRFGLGRGLHEAILYQSQYRSSLRANSRPSKKGDAGLAMDASPHQLLTWWKLLG